MKITLKSYLITFISLFIFQESVNAGECYGKVIGGPFSGKENIQISKFLEKSSFAIYSLLNIDLKKATADDVEKKWFDNFEKLNFKFPKVNLVRVYPYSGKGWSGLNNGYFIPIPNKPNEYLQANKEGKYGRGTFGIWPYLANDNKIYHIGFEPYKSGSYGETKCVFTDKHNSIPLSDDGPRYFAYEFSVDPTVYMWQNQSFDWGDQRKINGHILKFTYYEVELESLESIPGFEFK